MGRTRIKTDRIAALLDGHRTAPEIAKVVGCWPANVYAAVMRLGRESDLGYIYKKAAPANRRHTVVLRNDVACWVSSQTPDGASAADVITAIVEDAYLDAQESKA